MKLLLQWAMFFFGTLFAAGLLALGEPPSGDAPARHHQSQTTGGAMPAAGAWHELTAAAQAAR